MDNMIPCLLLSLVIVVCAMPAVLWWCIKYVPVIIMSCSKIICIVLFLTTVYWAGDNDLHNTEGRRKWMEKIEGNAGKFNYSDHNINTSSAGKAIVVEDDE